jgi:protein SCO1
MSRTRIVAILLAAVAAMAIGFWLSSFDIVNPVPGFQGSLLDPPRRIAIPALIKDDGASFTQADITGHWSLMFFGYTHCPDVCPTALNALAAAKKAANDYFPGREFPHVIFVSVDPERDTTALLHDYVRYFDPDFTGVSGDEKMIQALTLQMSVVYMKVPSESTGNSANDDNYLVDHSSAILLLNPEGELAAFLQPPHTPRSILDSLNKIIRE